MKDLKQQMGELELRLTKRIGVLEAEKKATQMRVTELEKLTRRVTELELAELRRIKKEMKKEPEIVLASDSRTFLDKLFGR